jgi:uncharacterized protein (DUF4415 family)
MRKKISDSRASRPDDDNPEWTSKEFAAARPATEVLPEYIGETATQSLIPRARGRPQKPAKKVNQTLRLDPDVLEAYRRQGKGWQRRINEVLRRHMPESSGGGPVDADS